MILVETTVVIFIFDVPVFVTAQPQLSGLWMSHNEHTSKPCFCLCHCFRNECDNIDDV